MITHSSLSKLSCPLLPSTVLHRERLVAKLHEAVTGISSTGYMDVHPSKLVLLCAPAGYGKTTLLADFARSSTVPCCWYFLDQSDGEPATFLTLLTSSIRQCFPQFDSALDSLLSNIIAPDAAQPRDVSPFDLVIDALTQAIANDIPEHFALLLCNYHEINDYESINRLMDRLLSQLPGQCTVILESRALPSLSTAPLLSKREMFGMGGMALRFSARELQQLSQHLGLSTLDMGEAEHLTKLFDGWIMGILLGTHLGNLQLLNSEAGDLPILSTAPQTTQQRSLTNLTIREDRLQLFFSLVNEVFLREPELYGFLKEAAILEEMTPTFCNALLDIENAGEHLHSLERQGLFVTRSATLLQAVYTCHPLLREFFRRDLASQALGRFRWLHQRAAELFWAEQNYGRAIWHTLEAKLPELAIEMILAIQKDLLKQGQGTTLAQWIDMLPVAIKSEHPQLQLLRVRIHLLFGELDQALPLLESVSRVVDSQMQGKDHVDRDILQAEIALTRSRAFFQAGQYVQAQLLCQRIAESLSVDMGEFLAEAHHLLGVCANVQGNVAEGIAHLQKALQLWGRDKIIRQTAESHSTLASAYSLLGNFALADHHSSRAIVYWEQLQDDWGRAYHLIRIGMVKLRRGSLNEAETFFKEALGVTCGPIHFQRGEAYALVSLGELYLEQGRYDEALSHTENGLSLARKVKDQYLIHYTLCILAMTYGFMKDPQTALLILSEAESLENKNASYERMMYELTMGTIWLEQGEYKKAYNALNTSKALTAEKDLVREQIQAGIRLAASQQGLGRLADMRQSLDDLVPLLAQESYAHQLLTELQRLPDLQQIVMNGPEYILLRSHLSLGESAFVPAKQIQARTGDFASVEVAVLPRKEEASLKVLALGEPLVLRDGIPITRWRMARAMELCFFLLDTDQPLRKEQIITALWQEVDDQVDQTFRSTIYYLKKALGEHFVLGQSGMYTLDKTLIWYDIEDFYEHRARSRAALAQKNLFAAREDLLKMVDLYRGDYVRSFYSDWCSLRRDTLRQAYLEARRELAKISWQLEWFEECTMHWQQMLAIDHCLEDAHYGLMRCYLKQGKRGLALRQYQRCSTIMHEELGVVPGPMIQHLYQRLVGTNT